MPYYMSVEAEVDDVGDEIKWRHDWRRLVYFRVRLSRSNISHQRGHKLTVSEVKQLIRYCGMDLYGASTLRAYMVKRQQYLQALGQADVIPFAGSLMVKLGE